MFEDPIACPLTVQRGFMVSLLQLILIRKAGLSSVGEFLSTYDTPRNKRVFIIRYNGSNIENQKT